MWLLAVTGTGNCAAVIGSAGGKGFPRTHGNTVPRPTHVRPGPGAPCRLLTGVFPFRPELRFNPLGLREVFLTRASTCWHALLDQGQGRIPWATAQAGERQSPSCRPQASGHSPFPDLRAPRLPPGPGPACLPVIQAGMQGRRSGWRDGRTRAAPRPPPSTGYLCAVVISP